MAVLPQERGCQEQGEECRPIGPVRGPYPGFPKEVSIVKYRDTFTYECLLGRVVP